MSQDLFVVCDYICLYINYLEYDRSKSGLPTISLCFSKFLFSSIEIVNVCGMMLAVVQAHDLPADHRLQSTVFIGQFWKSVLLASSAYRRPVNSIN